MALCLPKGTEETGTTIVNVNAIRTTEGKALFHRNMCPMPILPFWDSSLI